MKRTSKPPPVPESARQLGKSMPREVSTPLVVPKPGPPPSPPTPPPSRGFPPPSSQKVATLDPAVTTGPQAPLPLSLLTGPLPALPSGPYPAVSGPPSSRGAPVVAERSVAPQGRGGEGIPLRYVILSAIFLAIAVVGFGVWLVFGVIAL